MKYLRYLVIVLAFLLILPQVVLGSAIEREYEQAREIGAIIGYNHGLVYDHIPTLNEVIAIYEMYFSNKDSVHRNYFIEGYYEGFEKTYKKSDSAPIAVEPVEYADVLGFTLGEIYGIRDCEDGKKYNPRSALPSDNTIIVNYKLGNLSYEDRISFLKTFKESFEKGYREGYIRVNFNSFKISYDGGLADGEYFGSLLGEMNGIKDFLNGLNNNYKRNMPSDKKIEADYSLDDVDKNYREGFISGFKEAYEESYNESYYNAKTEDNKKPYENGYANGKESGLEQGQFLATEDFSKNMENDWRRHYPSTSEIIRDYNLILQNTAYRNSFISGFIEGLYQGYNDEFERLYSQFVANKSVIETIPLSGGEIKSADGGFTLKVDKGTYYNPVTVKLEAQIDTPFNGLIKASEIYKVSIINKSGELDNEKHIELVFEYYGGNNGGIYKKIEDKWIYIPSIIEDGYIKAFVKPDSIKENGSTYGVFVDKNYEVLLDVRSHWAKDEIIAYQRRGIVSGYSDRTFRPDKEITWGEFLLILNRVYKWIDSSNPSIKDVMQYALDKGYIENTYSNIINAPITYREVESVMRKIFNSDSFQWYNVSAKMLYEKQYKCKSYYSKDNNMTRAEAIYMLYIINEWRY
ncbi:MAG TPA: S-layer homology domain-containing protein [Tissierellia bacterium]|nr:S-layer homology domain-containing protein [Tissierellia bacterium]